jgi:hypothetical protein
MPGIAAPSLPGSLADWSCPGFAIYSDDFWGLKVLKDAWNDVAGSWTKTVKGDIFSCSVGCRVSISVGAFTAGNLAETFELVVGYTHNTYKGKATNINIGNDYSVTIGKVRNDFQGPPKKTYRPSAAQFEGVGDWKDDIKQFESDIEELTEKIASSEWRIGQWEVRVKKQTDKISELTSEIKSWRTTCSDEITATLGTLVWDLDEMTIDVAGNLELTGKSKAAKLTMKSYVVVNNGAYIHVQKSQIKSNKNLGGGSMGMKIGAK